jgi:sugar/nucleoside kinase (ribokinase family)
MKNITVIGTINKDTIIFPDKTREESFGGILFNILALSHLGERDVRIFPVCNLGYDVYDQVMEYLKKCKNVEISGIRKVNKKNNHAFLIYDEKNERKEVLRNSVPQISLSQIKPYLKSDMLLINFISGFDLSLDTLQKIRKDSFALVFMDLHSFLLGIRENGQRFFRASKDWRKWVGQADILQMNFSEFSILAKNRLESSAKIRNFGKYISGLGPKILLVTNGNKMSYCFQKINSVILYRRIGVPRIDKVVDVTGCGDVFSAGFIISYLRLECIRLKRVPLVNLSASDKKVDAPKPEDVVRAFEYANFVASQKCRFSGIEKLKFLSQYRI